MTESNQSASTLRGKHRDPYTNDNNNLILSCIYIGTYLRKILNNVRITGGRWDGKTKTKGKSAWNFNYSLWSFSLSVLLKILFPLVFNSGCNRKTISIGWTRSLGGHTRAVPCIRNQLSPLILFAMGVLKARSLFILFLCEDRGIRKIIVWCDFLLEGLTQNFCTK